MAATTAVLSLLNPGDNIIAIEDIYGGTYRMLEQVYPRYQISTSYLDMKDIAALEQAIRPETKLVWIESPTNPLLQVVDIAAIASVCRAKGVLLAVDNTFASPYLQLPLVLGAHIVVHSTTKYINGHSDAVGGAVITNEKELFRKIRFYQNAAGAVPGPFECWLTLRGVKTVAVRLRAHNENAMAVAQYLQSHPDVEAVHYPGLDSHPQHDLAKKQMRGFGGMVTFQIRGGAKEANSFFKALKIFSFAESLGGVESLACFPSAMSHSCIPRETRERRGITDGTIRLSIGIEDAEDIIADLEQALRSAFGR
jgi:cystathionine beta-lyase/cystathionine gamma-synthase